MPQKNAIDYVLDITPPLQSDELRSLSESIKDHERTMRAICWGAEKGSLVNAEIDASERQARFWAILEAVAERYGIPIPNRISSYAKKIAENGWARCRYEVFHG